MRIAVISDIHANLHALEAVLRDIEREGVDEILCAGDLVGYGPHPNEVVERIRTLDIRGVQGNYDEAAANARLVCGCDYPDPESMAVGAAALAWTVRELGAENKEYLRGLPARLRFQAGAHDVLLVHGSPRRINEYLYEDAAPDVLREIFREWPAGVLIVGHTHRPYHRRFEGRHVVNAGSVGQSRDGDPRSSYVLVDFGAGPGVRVVRVPYDVEATAAGVLRAGLPLELAQALRGGSSYK
ncbi:metallophosphoesterase family protein [Candidatus Desulforudis audaxviator]|uniref:Phosphoesterase n=1 Tax=Desulforudis audaxviator (strain MP104C) TaxID=477974 RepID=B1I5W8_DESAP|nr:metallophosphoesterase family protein [Candidatus Desulforudis audaxviator]ACA60448.1 phosphodiesterase, MJ0936 family [Candidatus Desulforudis audaxviator MP104C]AZK60513.1 phosphodiesterase, MJ0936 family [Candidatus Desulforudis audaxviator]